MEATLAAWGPGGTKRPRTGGSPAAVPAASASDGSAAAPAASQNNGGDRFQSGGSGKGGRRGRGGGRANGGQGGQGGGGGRSMDDSMLATLVRDHLHLRSDVEGLRAALGIIVIIHDGELKKSVHDMCELWNEQRPPQQQRQQQQQQQAPAAQAAQATGSAAAEEGGGGQQAAAAAGPTGPTGAHPMGASKRSVAASTLLKAVKQMCEGELAHYKAGIDRMLAREGAVWDSCIATFRSRYSRPAADRPWIWTMTLRQGADPNFLAEMEALTGFQTRAVRMAREAPRQTAEAGELWRWLLAK
mmetsp:Transcript_7449/g.21118  ORF Transcript_7449/g.21118 Transcript_7449/m.21118 type:complete len:301 (+) Transcript_7449:68-970(+)